MPKKRPFWGIAGLALFLKYFFTFEIFSVNKCTATLRNMDVILERVMGSYPFLSRLSGFSIIGAQNIVVDNELQLGDVRVLETNSSLTLFSGSTIRILITSQDVIHCFTLYIYV